jgi:ABC-type transport system involved in multi-copper enzyme maturation permease subunit
MEESMIWTLIRKEIAQQILSIRFYVSFALALVFLILSTYMLATDYGWLHREMGPLMQESFYTEGFSWYTLNRNIPTLRVLVTGLDEELSLRSENESFTGPRYTNNRKFVYNPNHSLFSRLDFAFFISIVGSLLAFVFTYDAISGERQRGTLRLMMANPTPRGVLLLAKFLGSYISFVMALTPALVGVVLVLYLHPDVDLSAQDWQVVCFLLLLSLLYICVFFMLGIFASCVTREPKTTLTLLMMLWVFLVLVIPNLSPFLAARLHPVRSLHEVEGQIAALKADLRQQTMREIRDSMRWANWNDLSQEEKETAWRLLDETYTYRLMKFGAGESAKIRAAFLNEIAEQARVSQLLSLISPSAAYVFLASDLADTGLESEWGFRRAIFSYRRQYAEYVDRYIQRTGDKNRLWRVNKRDSPPFEYRGFAQLQAIGAHPPQFMVLVVYSVLLFLGAQIVFLRSQL